MSNTKNTSTGQFIQTVCLVQPDGTPYSASSGTGVAGTPSSDVITVQGITGATPIKVNGDVLEIPISLTSGTASNWYDVSNYAELIIQISSLGTGPTSASLQWSNDNGTTIATSASIQSHAAQNSIPSVAMIANSTYRAPRYGRYFRLLTSATITSGTFSAIVECFNSSSSVIASGVQLNGQGSHGTAISSNPVRLAGRALTANYTAVATGQTADFISTLVGAQIHKPYSIPEADWQFACATGGITNTSDVVVAAAAGAGLKNYCTGIQLINASGLTATEVVLKSGSTVIWRGYVHSSNASQQSIKFATPIQTTANAALNFACITNNSQVYISAQGYIAP